MQVDLAGVQFFEQDEEFFHGAGDAVGLVDDEGVAGLEGGQGRSEFGSFGAGAGGLDDDVAAACAARASSWWSWVRALTRA